MSTKAEIKDDKLTIEIAIAPYNSASGKTIVLASTHGNQVIDGLTYKGKAVFVGLNVYVKKE